MIRRWAVAVIITSMIPIAAAAESTVDAFTARIHAEFPDVPTLTTTDLAAWLADSTRQPPLLIDARSTEEFAVSHLAGAQIADGESAVRKAVAGATPATPIVVYCSVGYRSAQLARELQRRGFSNVKNLDGSIFAWANEGRPIVRGDQIAKTVHPYNWLWGRMLRADLHARLDE